MKGDVITKRTAACAVPERLTKTRTWLGEIGCNRPDSRLNQSSYLSKQVTHGHIPAPIFQIKVGITYGALIQHLFSLSPSSGDSVLRFWSSQLLVRRAHWALEHWATSLGWMCFTVSLCSRSGAIPQFFWTAESMGVGGHSSPDQLSHPTSSNACGSSQPLFFLGLFTMLLFHAVSSLLYAYLTHILCVSP